MIQDDLSRWWFLLDADYYDYLWWFGSTICHIYKARVHMQDVRFLDEKVTPQLLLVADRSRTDAFGDLSCEPIFLEADPSIIAFL